MSKQNASTANDKFLSVVNEITHIGYKKHAADLVDYAKQSYPYVKKSIREISPPSGQKKNSCLVVSAGPGVRRKNSIKRIKESNYQGTIIAADGAYINCLQHGLIPDYVLTLDPHPTRIVRWFGDPDFEKHTAFDDYF